MRPLERDVRYFGTAMFPPSTTKKSHSKEWILAQSSLAGCSLGRNLKRQRHRAVVLQSDGHLGSESPSLHIDALRSQGIDKRIEERLSQFRWCGMDETGATPLADVSIKRELRQNSSRAAHTAKTKGRSVYLHQASARSSL